MSHRRGAESTEKRISRRRAQTTQTLLFGRPDRTKNAIRLAAERVRCYLNVNDITYAINGAVFEVNRVLGPGFLEKVYENALMVELEKRGLKAENQVPIDISYKGKAVGEYVSDVLVEDKVLIELKTVEQIDRIHEAQLLNYLKATGLQVGLLVNFKHEKADIKRLVLNLPKGHDSY